MTSQDLTACGDCSWASEIARYEHALPEARQPPKFLSVCFRNQLVRSALPPQTNYTGVREEDLDRAETMLEWPLPVHLRLLYRFHNGQAR